MDRNQAPKPGHVFGSRLALIVIALLIFVPPALIRERAVTSRFDDTHLKQIIELQPDHVLIGTSPLLSRMDPEQWSRLRVGEKIYILGELGSMSSLWYLWFKNSLIASQIKPKTVFFFFRDTELTNPEDETNSLTNKAKIASHRLPDDHRFDVIVNANKSMVDRLRNGLFDLYPIQENWRKQGIWLLGSAGFFFSEPRYRAFLWKRLVHPEQITPAESFSFFRERFTFQERMTAELFHPGNQRVSRKRLDPEDQLFSVRYLFDDRLPRSFLPEMIRLGKAASLKMFFIHMEHRPAEDGRPVAYHKWLAGYMDKLKNYLQQEGVGFYDFNNDPAMRSDMYLDGGHVKPEYKAFYTEHFIQKLAEYLP
ncbi:MAG: hypothetical protein HQL91_03920 [Magnetococcales bacterium]|nr:hypothetical protein [Magnetococcales bacterium]